ncbi:hypothetical protein CGLO_15279 [Colletotrichum gloeosporioides Cg-14]|uniref:Uncharacterized protein n=1 Tax=Colletotrichum gloeosporioides (strain Cg-14) TaxID=1237896 RepID=T0LBY6_COLGC|nr:hypothetical protein CGLO_15279 [Colletotrichum gloeosporioides Cg-14]
MLKSNKPILNLYSREG